MQLKIVNYDVLEQSNSVDLQRGAMFGDGFFTTGLVENGCLVNRQKHLSRLHESAELLKFENLDHEELANAIDLTANENPQSTLRISCSRVQKERGYTIGLSARILCEIQVHPVATSHSVNCKLSIADTPISVNSMLAGIKHLNRLDNVLAASECSSPRHEVLMCDREKVISGSRSNVFVKISGKWVTPLIENCGIKGIMRSTVIENMKREGLPHEIRPLYKKELPLVTSAFVTNSLLGVWPVESINGKFLQLNEIETLQSKLSRISKII